MTWPCLLRVDESMPRLKSLRHRGLLVTRRSTILCRSRLRLLSFFHLPVCLNPPRPRQLSTSYPCVSVHPCDAYPSRTDAARSSTGRTRRSGTCSTMPHRRALPRSALSASCRCSSGSRRESKGVDKSAGTSTMLVVSSCSVVSVAR